MSDSITGLSLFYLFFPIFFFFAFSFFLTFAFLAFSCFILILLHSLIIKIGPYQKLGTPVVQDIKCSPTDTNIYCVGQPSAVVFNDLVYLFFTEVDKPNMPGPNPGYPTFFIVRLLTIYHCCLLFLSFLFFPFFLSPSSFL